MEDRMRKCFLPAFAFLLAWGVLGCNGEQIARYRADELKAEKVYAATTQATATAEAVERQAESAVALMPDGPAKAQALDALAKAKGALDKARAVESQAAAVLAVAKSTGDALAGSGTIDTSGLAVFGPYGAAAGIVLSLGFGVWRQVQNSGLLKSLEKHQDALEAFAGTRDPHEALAAASQPGSPDVPDPAPAKAL
jgi:hypothetical protein